MPRGIYIRKNGKKPHRTRKFPDTMEGDLQDLRAEAKSLAGKIVRKVRANGKDHDIINRDGEDISFENFVEEARKTFNSKDTNSDRASVLSRLYEAVEACNDY
jgi:hypothetical protein